MSPTAGDGRGPFLRPGRELRHDRGAQGRPGAAAHAGTAAAGRGGECAGAWERGERGASVAEWGYVWIWCLGEVVRRQIVHLDNEFKALLKLWHREITGGFVKRFVFYKVCVQCEK